MEHKNLKEMVSYLFKCQVFLSVLLETFCSFWPLTEEGGDGGGGEEMEGRKREGGRGGEGRESVGSLLTHKVVHHHSKQAQGQRSWGMKSTPLY